MMTMDVTEQQYLRALFCLSRAGRLINAETIARTAGIDATKTTVATITLSLRGYIDSERLRLTMKGLRAAAALMDMEHLERRGRIAARARQWIRAHAPVRAVSRIHC